MDSPLFADVNESDSLPQRERHPLDNEFTVMHAMQLRRRALRRLLATLAVFGLLAVYALGEDPDLSKKQNKLLEHTSGFLGDNYDRLKADPGNDDWLIYFRSPHVLERSDTFYVEHVKVYLAPDAQAQQKDVDPADLEKLADHFTVALKHELEAGHYNVVDAPRPGTKILKFAITDVEPNGNKTNAVVSGTEAVATHAVMPGAGMLVPRIKVGKVSVEGEMVDAGSKQVDMAFMTAKSGRRFFSGIKAFQKWGDIDAAFKGWSKNFRKRLDQAHDAVELKRLAREKQAAGME